MKEILIAAVSAFFGVVAGLSLEWWKSSRSQTAALCDEFCSVIAEAADAGAQYWLMAGVDPQAPLWETRLHGFQRRITGYNVLLTGRLHDDALDEIQTSLAHLFTKLTGGEFGEPTRAPDVVNAKCVQDQAGESILSIRRGFFDTVSFQETLWRRLSRFRPTKPHPWFGE